MSLETLCEAAEYIEKGSEQKARGENFDPSVIRSNNSLNEVQFESSSEKKNEKRRTGGSGTREVHNTLEKQRRAQLKTAFESLKNCLPPSEEKKTSNLWILKSALKCIQILNKEHDEYEIQTKELLLRKQKLSKYVKRLKSTSNIKEEFNESNSTSTASEGEPNDDEASRNSGTFFVNVSPLNKGENSTSLKNFKDISRTSFSNQLILTTTAAEKNETCETESNKYKIQKLSIITYQRDNARNEVSSNINHHAQIRVGPVSVSNQLPIVPQLGVNANNNVLTHSTLQLVASPSVRVITPPIATRTLAVKNVGHVNRMPSSLQQCTNSEPGQTNPLSAATSIRVVKNRPSAARVLTQPSNATQTPSATIVKGLIPGSGTNSSPIAITQITVKPNIVHQPIFPATVNFHTVRSTEVPSNSSLPVTSVPGQIVATSLKPGTQLAHVISPNQMHVASLGQVITTGPGIIPSDSSLMSVLPAINPSQIGKVIKSVAQIPIIPPQFIPQLSAVTTSPYVVMTTHPDSGASSTVTTSTEQSDKKNFPA